MTTDQGPWRPGPYGPQGPYGQYPGWAYPPQAPKPGTIPLRPLNVGDVISGVFGTIRRYPKPIFLPSAIIAGVAALLIIAGAATVAALLNGAPTDGSAWTDGQNATVGVAIIGGSLLFLIAVLVVSTVAETTATIVLGHAVLGRPMTVGRAWAESKPFLWRALATRILTGLAAVAVPLACGLPAGLIGALTHSPAASTIAAVMMIPGWIWALYVYVRLVLAVPVVVMERQRSVRTAIKRAWRLNHGAWWRSLGIPYLINMIVSFATQFLLIPFVILGIIALGTSITTDADGSPGGPTAAGVVALVVCLALGYGLVLTIAAPITPLVNGVLYLDRRMRTENLAPSLIEAAGVPPVPPFPGYGPPQPPAQPPADMSPPTDTPPPADGD